MILRISTCNVLFCKFVLLIRLFKNFTETKILIDILMESDCFSLPLRIKTANNLANKYLRFFISTKEDSI
jgi:hypothetical protein